MSRHSLVAAAFWLGALAPAASSEEVRLGAVEWQDPDLVTMRQSGPLIGRPGGLEASGASELLKSKLPVIAIMPTDVPKIFDQAGVSLEAGGFEPGTELNLAELEPDIILLDDGNTYDFQYNLTDDLILNLRGTRKIVDLPEGAELESLDRTDIAGIGDEISEAEFQYSRFGKVLYSAHLSCTTLEVQSFCRNADLVRAAADRSRLLFAGNPE